MSWLIVPTEPGCILMVTGRWAKRRDGADALWEILYNGNHEAWADGPVAANRIANALMLMRTNERKAEYRAKRPWLK